MRGRRRREVFGFERHIGIRQSGFRPLVITWQQWVLRCKLHAAFITLYVHTTFNPIYIIVHKNQTNVCYYVSTKPKRFEVYNFTRSNGMIILLLTIEKEYLNTFANCWFHPNSTLSVIAHPSFTIHHRRRKSAITRNASNFERAKLRGRMQGMP